MGRLIKTMQKLYIKPTDCFFFRDHRDFTSGEHSSAEGIFPPRPGSFYGALRSAYIHAHSDFHSFTSAGDDNVQAWMGTSEQKGGFALLGSFLAEAAFTSEEKLLLPCPLDYQIIESNDEKGSTAYALALCKEPVQASDYNPFRLYGPKDEKSASGTNRFIYDRDLKKALFHESLVKTYTKDQWVSEENKVGIALDAKTGQAQKHMLYQLNQWRFKNASSDGFISLAEQAPDFKDVDYLRFGGKNHPASLDVREQDYTLLDQDDKSELAEKIKQTGIGRIVLLTPAIWDQGDRPAQFQQGKLHLTEILTLDVMTACIGRPTVVGGWDIHYNRPKERKNAVPAGSVLYVQVRPEQAESFVEEVYMNHLSDQLSEEGYGLMVPGVSQFKEVQ